MRLEIDKHNIQTLAGMSYESLTKHYEDTRNKYGDYRGKDMRTEAYLMTVNSFIQKKQAEEAAVKADEV